MTFDHSWRNPVFEHVPPVDRLLSLGNPIAGDPVRDYCSEFEFTFDDVPALMHLATDRDLWADWQEPESVGPEHALEALAQLRAFEQLPALIEFINELDADYLMGDWVTECFGAFLLTFGPEIYPFAKDILLRSDLTIWMRSGAATALRKLAAENPKYRLETIDAIVGVIEEVETENDLNGILVVELIELKAVEAAPFIEREFSNDRIDTSFVGEWDDVRYELGLGPKPVRPPVQFSQPWLVDTSAPTTPRLQAEKRKAKRKSVKQARKRNRQR
jgi:Protein of unknown function (DUF1186)